MDLTDLMNFTGQFEDSLRSSGFARIHVGENTDIPIDR
jgi:hypothetical protein